MRCVNCSTEAREGARFCGECGTDLPADPPPTVEIPPPPSTTSCPTCGAEQREGALYCGACGTNLPAGPPPTIKVPPPPRTIKCPSCGAELPENTRLCPRCGTDLAPALPAERQSWWRDSRHRILAASLAAGAAAVIVVLAIALSGGGGGTSHPKAAAATRTPTRAAGVTTTSSTTTTTQLPTTTTVPSGSPEVDTGAVATNPATPQVARTFESYFGGIDSQNFQQAYATYSPNYQSSNPYGSFASTDATSSDGTISITSITQNTDGSVTADVTFTSQQAVGDGPVPGETCTVWTLAYGLVQAQSGGSLSYLIDSASPLGPGHVGCIGQP